MTSIQNSNSNIIHSNLKSKQTKNTTKNCTFRHQPYIPMRKHRNCRHLYIAPTLSRE
ncbi:hypothetical protein CV_3142 [Chromobacterium violaceum ATCC 12472]|uniref:Uncharacterized protein n=1 Tax=Chromobacterium violaceum (strain ATCC 12472 / DSM 30191 / JCM 1249 / CCUG 213 / NBRC 12614 / NCIMB 9131 / NCTC 9757 / MK) TaxID=243365 RepID=Q7NTB7_CHRVO|nr:hypothetical protein CV_3142 [Chromobacterium violaceum ATCC 12472]